MAMKKPELRRPEALKRLAMIRRPAFAFILLAAALSLVSGSVFAQAVPSSRADLTYSFSSVVKKAAPAVVNVFSRRVVQARNVSPFFNDPFFQQFFGDDFGVGVPQQRVQNSLGSGVIVRADGLIVTNNHVIKDSRSDPRRAERPARVRGQGRCWPTSASTWRVLQIDAGRDSCRPWQLARFRSSSRSAISCSRSAIPSASARR